VNVARPCLAVRVGDEARLFCLLRGGQHRQRTEPLHRNCKGHAAIAKKYVACPRPSDRYLSMIWCQVLGYAVTSARGEPVAQHGRRTITARLSNPSDIHQEPTIQSTNVL
jgi:hypothetical protein